QTSSAAATGLTYNALGQTTSITPSGGSPFGMTYAGSGQDTRLTAGQSSYRYNSTGMSSVSSGGSSSNVVRTPDGQLISEQVNGATYYFLLDGQGSVLDLVDSSGTVYDKYTYDPYGNTTSGNTTIARETVANPFRYLGAVLDASTGLYHLGARFYDPRLGRFTQPDPSNTGAPGDYTYGGDAPSSLSDPSGLVSVPIDGSGSWRPCRDGWTCLDSTALLWDGALFHIAGAAGAALVAGSAAGVAGLFGLGAIAVLPIAGIAVGVASAALMTSIGIALHWAREHCLPWGAMLRVTREHGVQAECWYP
ncbi:MAG: RHS repeat-associated core domain-containing protein, partial [Chloroflexota bacterium]